MSKEAAAKAVSIILASYPSVNKENLEGFYRMAVESLQEYQDEVLQAICHPMRGVQAKCKFVPSIAELREFCDHEYDKILEARRAEKREEFRRQYRAPEFPKSTPEEERERAAQEEERRERMRQKFKDLIAELSMAPDPMRKADTPPRSKVEEKAAAEAWLAAQAARAVTEAPPRLSERALKAYWLVG